MAFRTEYSVQMHPDTKVFKRLSAIMTKTIDKTQIPRPSPNLQLPCSPLFLLSVTDWRLGFRGILLAVCLIDPYFF